MKNPNAWHSRGHMLDIAAVTLIVIGIGAAIIFFPTLPVYSLVSLILFGVPGILIGYRQKHVAPLCAVSFVVTLALYFIGLGFSGIWETFVYNFPSESTFTFDFLTRILPLLAIGTVPVALLLGKQLTDEEPKTKSRWAYPAAWGLCLFFIAAFVFLGMIDYDVRGDTSPPQVLQIKVVDEWTNDWGEGEHDYWVRAETLDGKYSYSFQVGYYCGTRIGWSYEVLVHSGALGYEWNEFRR